MITLVPKKKRDNRLLVEAVIVIAVALILILILPWVLTDFRLSLLGRFLALSIAALGIDLIWGSSIAPMTEMVRYTRVCTWASCCCAALTVLKSSRLALALSSSLCDSWRISIALICPETSSTSAVKSGAASNFIPNFIVVSPAGGLWRGSNRAPKYLYRLVYARMLSILGQM